MAKAGSPSDERKARTRGNRALGTVSPGLKDETGVQKPPFPHKPKVDVDPNVNRVEGANPDDRAGTDHIINEGKAMNTEDVVVGFGSSGDCSEDHDNDEDSGSTVSTTSDSSSSEEDSGDDDEIEQGNKDGMSNYELMRQRRIARNEARLAGLGLSQIQKSTQMVVKKQTRSSKPLPQGPRRTLPGRKGRAQFFETMRAVTKEKEKVVEEEKNPDACDVCQSEEGGR